MNRRQSIDALHSRMIGYAVLFAFGFVWAMTLLYIGGLL
jgi:hypothetical protein